MGDPRILEREGDPKAILCICFSKKNNLFTHISPWRKGSRNTM